MTPRSSTPTPGQGKHNDDDTDIVDMFARAQLVAQADPRPMLDESMDMAALSMLLTFVSLMRERSALGFTHKIDFQAVELEGSSTTSLFRCILEEIEYEASEKTKADGNDSAAHRHYDLSMHAALAQDFLDWIELSRLPDSHAIAQQAIQDLRSKVARTRWKMLYQAVRAYNRLKRVGMIGSVQKLGADDPTELPATELNNEGAVAERAASGDADPGDKDGIDAPMDESIQNDPVTNGAVAAASKTGLQRDETWFSSQRLLVEQHFAGRAPSHDAIVETGQEEGQENEGEDGDVDAPPPLAMLDSSSRQQSEGLIQIASKSSRPREPRPFGKSSRKPSKGLLPKSLRDCRPNQQMIEETLEASLRGSFHPDSFATRLLHLREEIVSVDDKNSNDICSYIAVHHETVTVVLSMNKEPNWLNALHVGPMVCDNPIRDDYRLKHPQVKLFSEYAVHLLRTRKQLDNKDSKTSRGRSGTKSKSSKGTDTTPSYHLPATASQKRKLDDILDKAFRIGISLRHDSKFKLCLVGHGIGAALATITSFYAAAIDNRFLSMGPVRVFSFASPRVGDLAFLRAYRHLELTGRVLHARFVNQHDPATVWPFWGYHHVGLQIRLHGRDIIGKSLMRMGLYASYPQADEWNDILPRAFANNLVSQLTIPGAIAINHRLTEYYKRLDTVKHHYLEMEQTDVFVAGYNDAVKPLEWFYAQVANIPPEMQRELEVDGDDDDEEDLDLVNCTFLDMFTKRR